MLQFKVVVCFFILGAGRAVNVLVPYMYKIIGRWTELHGPYHSFDSTALLHLYFLQCSQINRFLSVCRKKSGW